MEYRIVTHYIPNKLAAEVNELIQFGWVPQGGVTSAAASGADVRYAQAMVREKK